MKFLYEMVVSMFIERDWVGIILFGACILLFAFFITWRVYRVVKAREYRDKLPAAIITWLAEERKELYRKKQLNGEITFEELLMVFSDRRNGVNREFLEPIWNRLIADGYVWSNPGFGGYLIFPLSDAENNKSIT